MNFKNIIFIITITLSSLLLQGCGSGFVAKVEDNRIFEIKKIAVLPFYNISGRKDAGRVVADAYVTELFKSGKYEVEEPGNVRHFMIQERVDVIGELEIEKIQLLGKRLKVDAVIVGTVEEYGGKGKNSVVTLSARLVRSDTGEVVWMNHRRKKGDDYTIVFDFGRIKSVTRLAHKVVAEMIKTIE